MAGQEKSSESEAVSENTGQTKLGGVNEISGGIHKLTIQGGEFERFIQKQENHTFHGDSATGDTRHPLAPGAFRISSHMSVLEKEPISIHSQVFRAVLHSHVTGDRKAVVKITPADEKHQREAKIHFLVPHHKNIVERILTDVFNFRGQSSIYIAMEQCDCSLDDHIKSQRKDKVPFDAKKYLSICRQIVVGLTFLHSKNVVHGDLKPGNVLLILDENVVKLCDFGLSRTVSGDKTSTEVTSPQGGTAGWQAPEVLEGTTKVGFKSDIFPLGLVSFYSLSYGKHPYGDKSVSWNHYIVNGKNRNFDGMQIPDARSARLLLESMLKQNPADRPTADEVLKHPLFAAEATNKVIAHRDELTEIVANSGASKIPVKKVKALRGHKKEVWCCSWNPTCDLLASCSSDSTAKIWDLTADAGKRASSGGLVLKHQAKQGVKNPVWRLDWNRDGTSLVTGSDDGSARIWTENGHLLHHLSHHREVIRALKWNKQGNYIVSGSDDKTAIIWDAQSGELKQQFWFHDAGINDVDWQDNDCFASCSYDKNIHVCRLKCNKPVKSFKGHSTEVYAVEWDPSKRFLASGSDDNTVKIWSMKNDGCIHDVKGHSRAVRKVRWSPAGPGSQNPNQKLVLASASNDGTVRLWEPERGVCLHKLEGCAPLTRTLFYMFSPAYSVPPIAFSPDGRLLASGGERGDEWRRVREKYVKIWNTQSGQLVRSYEGKSLIYDVCWNAAGTKVGAGAEDGTVIVLDLRK